MEPVLVMFFSWVDLWLAVTIILPYYSSRLEEADWTARARGDKGGDREREKKDYTRNEGQMQPTMQKSAGWAAGMKTNRVQEDRKGMKA